MLIETVINSINSENILMVACVHAGVSIKKLVVIVVQTTQNKIYLILYIKTELDVFI